MALTQNGVLKKDDNGYPVMGGVSSVDQTTIVNARVNPSTGRLLTDAASGAGTVTDVSVVTANGFAGTVATSTTTPAITLTTTVTGILSGNGTAISAATTTGTGDVVLATSPTLITPNIGAATGTSLTTSGALRSNTSLILEETGAGTDTITVQAPASIAASYTLTLPIDDGDNLQFLQTNGSGVLAWATPTGSGDVVGPASATDNAVARFDGTTGKLIQNSVVTIADTTGNIAGFQVLTFTGSTSGTTTLTATAISGTSALTLPAATDTLVGKATTDAFTNKTLTSGTNVLGAVTMTLGSDATGDTYYRSSGTVLTRLGIGSTGDVLTVAGGLPSWAAPASATTITVANEATDTTCFPVFVTAATGALGPKSNAGLTFNSNTSSLGATLMTATTSLTTASVLASSNDSGALGASGTAFADLFLASGGVINWAAGNVTLTHSTGILTQNAGELRITSANVGTNADSVPTLSSTSTLTNKTLTSPTIQTSPVLAAATNLKFTVPSSDVTATGITTNEFNSGYSSTAIGDLVYLDSSATWQKADADASAATYSSMLGIALSVAASAAPVNVLLQGFVYATPFPTLTIGAPVYMSATAGVVTNTAPTTTDSATRVVGYGVHADKMWFNPSNDWITHT